MEPTVWQVMSRRVQVSRTGVVTHEHCVAVCATNELAVAWIMERLARESKWGDMPDDERGAFFISQGPEVRGLVPA